MEIWKINLERTVALHADATVTAAKSCGNRGRRRRRARVLLKSLAKKKGYVETTNIMMMQFVGISVQWNNIPGSSFFICSWRRLLAR